MTGFSDRNDGDAEEGVSSTFLKEWSEDIFIVDGPTVDFFGCPYPTRSVIVRVENISQDLIDGLPVTETEKETEIQGGKKTHVAWMWSPIPYNKKLDEEVEQKVGPLRFIISPNKIHHIFLGEWAEKHPQAVVYLPPGLRGRKVIEGKLPLDDPGRVVDLVHSDNVKQEPEVGPCWRKEIDFVKFGGSSFMEEIVFFHSKSRTLIVCDLIQRHTEKSNPELFAPNNYFWIRKLMFIDGLIGLNGSTPREWRLSFPFWNRSQIREARSKVLRDWKPDRLIIAHGDCAEVHACDIVSNALKWM